ncbi:hypothetical protein BGW39_005067 [Mortierella sp. 14UC]|nr:hypothetical protein BGW39_005067 [Mortierella sp. 14UC]
MAIGNIKAGAHSKRGRPPTTSKRASKPKCLPVDPTSIGISSNGKVKRPRRLAKRQSPPTSMTRVFKMSDPAVHHIFTGAAINHSKSGAQDAGDTIFKYDNRASVGDGSKDELLLEQLCLALSSSANHNYDHNGEDDSSPSSSHRNSTKSTASVTSTASNGSGGQFGFLALGPLPTSSPRSSVSNKTYPVISRTMAINMTEEEEEKEGCEVVATTTTISRYMPILEELDKTVYSSPLDFEPEGFVPLQLGDDDFLPVFENISFTDDWQQQQQQQRFVSELSPWLLTLSSPLLQSSSNMMEFDFEGWDGQLSECRYDHSPMMASGATGMTNELDFTLLSPPTVSWSNEYDAGHVPLCQSMQQLLHNPTLSSSRSLSGLAVRQSPLP